MRDACKKPAKRNERARRATVGSIAFFASLSLSPIAWCQTAESLPADQAGRCRYGAEYMIEVARQGMAEQGPTGSRSDRELNEKRRKLVEEWTARLKRGEDPCAVYLDIQKAATTF